MFPPFLFWINRPDTLPPEQLKKTQVAYVELSIAAIEHPVMVLSVDIAGMRVKILVLIRDEVGAARIVTQNGVVIEN